MFDPTPLERLSSKLDTTVPALLVLDAYYGGTQPLSFLAPEAKKALGDRLRALAVNFPRLSVDVLAERLRIEGFRINGATDLAVWQAWNDNGMPELQHVLTTEALTLGSAYCTVWGGPNGPAISVDSAKEMAVERDPLTRVITSAVHRWIADNRAHAVLFEPHTVGLYESIASVPAGGVIPPEGWQQVNQIPNSLGVVPVVAFVNRGRLADADGISEMLPILDLSDALNKITADMLVSSEFSARPRRYATGIEIMEEPVLDADGLPVLDANGQPTTVEVSPFGDGPNRVWTSESPESRFGEFPGSNLAGYTSAVSILTNQIGALSGLPPHLLGVHGDQPSSADAIRSAESGLVQRAVAKQRTFGRSWSEVASLISQVATGIRPTSVQPVWASPETATPAQAADAASKLVAAGIVPIEQALDDLGYSPEQILAMQRMRTREAMNAAIAGANVLPRITP